MGLKPQVFLALTCNKWSSHNWQQVDQQVLERVAVNGTHPDRSRPLMVGLVNVLVKTGMVEEPVGERQNSEGDREEEK